MRMKLLSSLWAILVSACSWPVAVKPVLLDASQCPNLAGTYLEVGVGRVTGSNDKVAHLTWLILSARLEGEGAPIEHDPKKGMLYEWSKSRKGMTYLAEKIQVSHIAPDRLQLEAFDKSGTSLGIFQIGPEHGWTCRNGTLVKESAGGYGGADFVPIHTVTETRRLLRDGDGSLILAESKTVQRVSILLLGGPVGAPIISNTEERYPPAK